MNTLENGSKNLKVDPLVDSEPVKVLVVLSDVGAGGKVNKDSAKSEVLNSLEFI